MPVFFDLESQKLFEEVGGRDASRLGLACGVTWSTARNEFKVYWESDAAELVEELRGADRVIGFNLLRFDYEVLRPYAGSVNLLALPTLDILVEVQRALGFRLSLDSLARATLGESKQGDGRRSVEWFRNGELEKVAAYCKSDVEVTRRVYEYGRDHGIVYYHSRLGSRLKIPIKWK